jgi:hypothetical protein
LTGSEGTVAVNNDSNKFDEYSLFIEDTARFSDRRQTVSNTYVAANSLLMVAIGLIIKDLGVTGIWMLLLPIPLIISGIIISLRWYELIRNYKKLIRLRMDVLREMENKMSGIERMYHREDMLYPRDKSGNIISSRGINFSDIEVALPQIFILMYCLFGLGIMVALEIRLYCPW